VHARRLNLVLLALTLVAPGSCATCAKYQNVGIETLPVGAEIFLDGEKIGETPHRQAIERDRDHAVFLKKPGYRPELVVLGLNRPSDGLWFFTPADVKVELTPLSGSLDRSLEIELDE
jgi:hypothetical protein